MEGPLGPGEEEEEDSGLPGVPQAPQVSARKRPASPQESPLNTERPLGKMPLLT